MIVVCPGCKNQITIDDGTISHGLFKVRCTSCGRTINAQKKDEPAATSPKMSASSVQPEPAFGGTQTGEKGISPNPITPAISPAIQEYIAAQITSARREILDAMQALFRGGTLASPDSPGHAFHYSKRALVCSGDTSVASSIVASLNAMGYRSDICTTAADSIKSLDSQYGLIIIDPSFTDDMEGSKKIIGRINGKKGTERRQTFVVLVSSTHKTMDGNSAFLNGVNLILNKADLQRFDSVLQQGQSHFQHIYKAFRSVTGR